MQQPSVPGAAPPPGLDAIPLMRGAADEGYTARYDVSTPALITDIRPHSNDQAPAWMLIDGAYRVRRTYREGLNELRAYVLDWSRTYSIREGRTLSPGGAGAPVRSPDHP